MVAQTRMISGVEGFGFLGLVHGVLVLLGI